MRFSLKTQPWTLFQGAYRAVFLTAGNNYLKQPEPPFISKMSTISTWQNRWSPKTQQHRKSGDVGAVSAKYEIIYSGNENGKKVATRKQVKNPVTRKNEQKPYKKHQNHCIKKARKRRKIEKYTIFSVQTP